MQIELKELLKATIVYCVKIICIKIGINVQTNDYRQIKIAIQKKMH